jgi:hypothetical protein
VVYLGIRSDDLSGTSLHTQITRYCTTGKRYGSRGNPQKRADLW